MLLIVFSVLIVGCLAFWMLGAPVVIVFPLALAAWVAFTFLLLPKLRSYKVAMGFDDELNAIEAKSWAWLVLQLKGVKVLLFGFLTSMVPFLGSAAEWLNGQNLSFFFDANNPKIQQTVMFVIGALVFSAPFLTSWLHSGALADAASTDPIKPAPRS